MGLLPAAELASIQAALAQFSNADLVAIAKTGPPGPRGEVTADGPVLWTGSAPGYLAREDRDDVIDGRQVRRQVDTFTITDAAGAPLVEAIGPDWNGTVVEIVDRRSTPTSIRWRVADLVHNMNGLVDSVALELSDPVAAP